MLQDPATHTATHTHALAVPVSKHMHAYTGTTHTTKHKVTNKSDPDRQRVPTKEQAHRPKGPGQTKPNGSRGALCAAARFSTTQHAGHCYSHIQSATSHRRLALSNHY